MRLFVSFVVSLQKIALINMFRKGKNTFIIISIFGLLATFVAQGIWLFQSFTFTASELRIQINEEFNVALFKEAEIRACSALTSITISDVNEETPNITVFNDELYKRTKTRPNLNIIDSILCTGNTFNYNIHYIKNGKIISNSSNRTFLFPITTDTIYTRRDKSEGVYLELANPYSVFFEKMGLIMFINIIMLVITISCIVKQLNIIRIQRKTMQLRKDFTYAMVHDMKSPLSTITIGANALGYEKVASNADMREKYTRIMKDEAQHLFALVNKVLTISKLEEGKLEMNKVNVDIAPMVESIEEKFSTYPGKDIHFTNNFAAETVYADAEHLSEALSNLVDNAVKYSRKDVTIEIEISSRDTGSGVEIRVRDNGMGISKKDQKVIFDKFERASALGRTFKHNGPAGFGLGLSYVMQVIEAHGGIVGVDSEVGQYTEFTILLPNENVEETA